MGAKGAKLAEFVRAARAEKGFSLAQVEANSGGEITNGYVSRIENGYVTNPTPKKLQALARGLQIPVAALFAVLNGDAPRGVAGIIEARLASLAARINNAVPEVRDYALSVINMLEHDIERKIREARARRAHPLRIAASAPGGSRARLKQNQQRAVRKDLRDNVQAVREYEEEELRRNS